MRFGVFLIGVLLLVTAGAHAARTYKTPEITRIEKADLPGSLAWVMRGELGDTGFYLGLSIVCQADGSGATEVTAFFSSFPDDRRSVQLMVRSARGHVERFGPVVAAGPESGFHSPRITDPSEAERFLRLVLEPGSLVSNGYRSFRNRVSEARNREVLEAFLACSGNQGR